MKNVSRTFAERRLTSWLCVTDVVHTDTDEKCDVAWMALIGNAIIPGGDGLGEGRHPGLLVDLLIGGTMLVLEMLHHIPSLTST